jgi:hypothetical protein
LLEYLERDAFCVKSLTDGNEVRNTPSKPIELGDDERITFTSGVGAFQTRAGASSLPKYLLYASCRAPRLAYGLDAQRSIEPGTVAIADRSAFLAGQTAGQTGRGGLSGCFGGVSPFKGRASS